MVIEKIGHSKAKKCINLLSMYATTGKAHKQGRILPAKGFLERHRVVVMTGGATKWRSHRG